MTIAVLIAGLLSMIGFAPGSGVAHAASQASGGPGAVAPGGPPFWCQFVPPELRPFVPQCQIDAEVGEVNEFFQATGPWDVTTDRVSGPSPVGTVDLFHPTDLGANDIQHPVLIWSSPGDGDTGGGTPDAYTTALNHLASWGFVVVATGSPDDGGLLLEAADWAIAQNDAQFEGTLDTENVGVFGHSQGAGASSNASVTSSQSGGPIDSTLTLHLPDPIFANPPAPPPAFDQLTHPIFFLTATGDPIVSPDSVQQTFFNQTAGPAAKGSLIFDDPTLGLIGHNVIQNEQDPILYLGFITAWFKYTLEEDPFAGQAFAGDQPQFTVEPGWTNQQLKNLS